jgi:hypothetical protein
VTSPHHVPSLETSWLLRYRFGEPEELRRHLRLPGAGPGFLFLDDHLLPFATGSRVVLEVSFKDGGHRTLFRGSIRSRERDGLWLELPHAHAALGWIRSTKKARREDRRVSADLLAEVRMPGRPTYLCRVVDLGPGGARLSCGATEVTLLPPDPGLPSADVRGRVAWLGRREIGISFREPPPQVQDLVCIFEARWERSDLLSHSESCVCAQSASVPPEPPAYWLAG